MTSESNASTTSRPSSGIASRSPIGLEVSSSSRVFQPYTPFNEAQPSPAVMAASAFLAPSVIHSGTEGSRTWSRASEFTSSRLCWPVGVRYRSSVTLPSLALEIGLSGRYWPPLALPSMV